MKKRTIMNRIAAIFCAAALICAGFGACAQVEDIANVVSKMTEDLPSAENTMTSLVEINKAMEDAMSRGETELTFNATGVQESDLRDIGYNLSTFWGKPDLYSINSEYTGLENIIPGQAVDVKNITNTFTLSNNYYVLDNIRNGTPIPEDKPYAREIADALPGIAAGIFTDPAASDYEKTLAAHDWLVAHIEYDETIDSISEENGSYGAIILNRTMCQGYAEALELLLKCYTDVEIVQVVGNALNAGNEDLSQPETDASGDDEAETETDAGSETEAPAAEESGGDQETEETSGAAASWDRHAWNAVNIDGLWYQVDTTFDDPLGTPAGLVTHFYFGQTDAVMSEDHRWDEAYFPEANAENFLFFRQSGLFAEDWDSFEAIVTDRLSPEDQVLTLEAAILGATIDEDNIQFIYEIRDDLEMILWSEQVWQDIYVQSIELQYYAES